MLVAVPPATSIISYWLGTVGTSPCSTVTVVLASILGQAPHRNPVAAISLMSSMGAQEPTVGTVEATMAKRTAKWTMGL